MEKGLKDGQVGERTVTKLTRELYLNGYFTHELCRGKYAMVTHHPLKKRITEMK